MGYPVKTMCSTHPMAIDWVLEVKNTTRISAHGCCTDGDKLHTFLMPLGPSAGALVRVPK